MSDVKNCTNCILENGTPKVSAIPLEYHTVNRDPEFRFLHSELFLCWAKYLVSRTENPERTVKEEH